MQWVPPFTDASAKLIYENPTQMIDVRFSPDGSIMFFTENNTTVAMFVNDMTTKYTIARGGGGGQGRAGGAQAGGGQAGGRGGPAARQPGRHADVRAGDRSRRRASAAACL